MNAYLIAIYPPLGDPTVRLSEPARTVVVHAPTWVGLDAQVAPSLQPGERWRVTRRTPLVEAR